jgi:hypothetical protein
MEIFGTTIFVLGHSISAILSTGTYDIIIVSVNKNNGATNWVRRVGTSQFDEFARALAIYPSTGAVFATGIISAVDFSYGGEDILIFGLTSSGDTIIVENMGNSNKEEPNDIVWDPVSNRFVIYGWSASTYLAQAGGADWLIFNLDYKGRN